MRIARRKFGNTELHVSALGLGTAEVGFSETGDDAFDSMLGVASDAGINVLDSAAMYGDAEESLGRLLAGRRDQFLIFTKCGRHLPIRSPRPRPRHDSIRPRRARFAG